MSVRAAELSIPHVKHAELRINGSEHGILSERPRGTESLGPELSHIRRGDDIGAVLAKLFYRQI
jgi:hypothetical protein